MAKTRLWSVATTGTRPLADIARDLKQRGFDSVRVLEDLGLLTGHADEDQIEACRAVAGVASIEPEPTFDVGPPGSRMTH
jgi:hypothetical protein